MKLNTYEFVRTTPIHDRGSDEVLLEAGPDEVAAIIALIEDGDEDAALLLLAMWAEHIYLGGENVQFVLNGTAMMPYTSIALGMVLDAYLDAPLAVDKVTEAVDDMTVAARPMMVQDEGETRVELRPMTSDGVVVNAWVVMNDVEVFEVFDNAEAANEALLNYLPPPEAPTGPEEPPPQEPFEDEE